MIKPTKLLQHLGMIRIFSQYTFISFLGKVVFLLLLINMSSLEPNVDFGQWLRRVVQDVAEALEEIGKCVINNGFMGGRKRVIWLLPANSDHTFAAVCK